MTLNNQTPKNQPPEDKDLSDLKNAALSALALEIDLQPVAGPNFVAGKPLEGTAELGKIAGAEVGVWELREGTVIDTEVDEIFIVLDGEAKIEILDDAQTVTETFTVTRGDVMRLVAGTKTRWTVSEFIRKVYVA